MNDILSAPLNQAHQVERQAERLTKKRLYDEAANLYGKAAELIKTAIDSNQEPEVTQSLEIQYDRLKQIESRLEFTARQDTRHVERLERERAIEHLKRSEMTDFVREIEFRENPISDDDDNEKAGGNYLAFLKEKKSVTVDEGLGSLSKKELYERLDLRESQLDRFQCEVRRLRDDLERVTRERNSARAELERFQNFDDLSALGSLPPLESPPTLKF